MKKNLFVLCAIFASLMLFTSCDNEGGGGHISSGYAPTSIPSGQTLSGASSYFDFGSGTISLSSLARSFGYDSFVGTPTVNYKRTSSNSATLSWSATVHNKGMLDVIDAHTETMTGNVTLFFISPSEGYASGTENGKNVSDRHFTLL